jgi:hypothetical protein
MSESARSSCPRPPAAIRVMPDGRLVYSRPRSSRRRSGKRGEDQLAVLQQALDLAEPGLLPARIGPDRDHVAAGLLFVKQAPEILRRCRLHAVAFGGDHVEVIRPGDGANPAHHPGILQLEMTLDPRDKKRAAGIRPVVVEHAHEAQGVRID